MKFQSFSSPYTYKRKALVREVLADLDTPLSTYLRLANKPNSYLFESVQGGEKWSRYSIIGLPCETVFKIHENQVDVFVSGQQQESFTVENPLDWVADLHASFSVPEVEELPGFSGGLVGYFGYETIAYIEQKLQQQKPDELELPDILLMLSEELVVFDNLSGKLFIIIHVQPDQEQQGIARLDELQQQLAMPLNESRLEGQASGLAEDHFSSGFTQEGFKEAVGTARDYIAAGDIMQVVLSQRMSIPFDSRPLDLYRALRILNPSPYMYYLQFDDFDVVGSSPEILVRAENGEVTVRPIAGTRPRGETEQADLTLEQELLADPKELAEHIMLIDLGRNDVGRVSETGSVKVNEKMSVERYSHVMHIVSNVIGKLQPKLTAIDVLKACFPAGTVSGAPKIRAMEIIAELEPVKRGVYSGAIGYLGWDGNMDTAIAIRTAVIKNDMLHIQAGAGIVYDSEPELEWQETMNKARGVIKAVEMAMRGGSR